MATRRPRRMTSGTFLLLLILTSKPLLPALEAKYDQREETSSRYLASRGLKCPHVSL
jgi:hypothetical protein